MKIANTVSNKVDHAGVADELATALRDELGAGPVDLLVLFCSAHYEDEIDKIVERLHEALRPRAFVGASAEAVIADELEYESQPAITLWAARLPDVEVRSFHLAQDDLERLGSTEELVEHLTISPEDGPSFLLVGDPFSINILELLNRLSEAYPGRPALGGLASAAAAPLQNAVVFDGQVLHHGVAGVALWGNIAIDTVVSQGCRPIGRHFVITRAEKNIIHELGGKPPLVVVHELLQNSSRRDTELARTGLLIGTAINEYQEQFERGDFLIRNPIGFDANTGALAVSDLVRTGQTVQFHVRDRESADDDLVDLLSDAKCGPAAGALLFSCNGRGTRLFNHRHHDARAVVDHCGQIPVSGFFAAGEIGPVGPRNFLHGLTASIGFFRPASKSP